MAVFSLLLLLSPCSCSLTPCVSGKVDYDPSKIIRVYVGLNNKDVNEVLKKNKKMYERQVDEVI
jgi:hypothetical protein